MKEDARQDGLTSVDGNAGGVNAIPSESGVEVIKCLSVRAPWWWWIVYGGKDIENRDWSTDYRGPVAIHASKWWTNVGFQDDWDSALDMAGDTSPLRHLSEKWTARRIKDLGGHIVGIVDIVGCVRQSASRWFAGKYGFVLANPRPLPSTVPVKGKLGFFNIPRSLLEPSGPSRSPNRKG